MEKFTINFNNVIGNIKPMHAVGQPPFLGMDFSYCKYLQDANIPYSRLHDVGGRYGRNEFVDIPNIFRDFNADENDPNSYDFEKTDYLIKQLYKYNCAPIFRLGVTIENDILLGFKPRRIVPPADFNKWARICEHIIMHYNEGWANGFNYGITYWEIWNEPENRHIPTLNQMWSGTKEQYYELYTVTATHLKKRFGDSIKVGGYASTGFYYIFHINKEINKRYGLNLPYRDTERYSNEKAKYRLTFAYEFLDYIKKHNAPLDFFSWHSYVDSEDTAMMARFVKALLTEYGYGDVETQLNEWNDTARIPNSLGTSFASAQATQMLLLLQNTPTDMLCYYDAKIGLGSYGGMFNPITYKPYPLYYAFKAFGHLYTLKNQVEVIGGKNGIYAVGATNGKDNAVMISNTTVNCATIKTNFDGNYEVYLIDEKHPITLTNYSADSFKIKKNQVILIKNKAI